MSDLNLEFIYDDGLADEGPALFSSKRSFVIVQRYFKNDISVQQAAKVMTDMLPDDEQRASRKADVGHFGAFLCLTAEQIPFRHPAQTRLVQLIQHLALSPKLSGQTEVDGYLLNYTMADFQQQLREALHPYFEDDAKDIAAEYRRALNISAFLARLTQCGFLSYSPFSIWTMRACLEEPVPHPETLDYSVSSAALWIILAGQTLYTQVVEAPPHSPPPPPSNNTGSMYAPGKLYHGPEFGAARWRFWNRAFESAAVDRKDSSDECRRLARTAAGLMRLIEQGMSF